MLSCAQNDRERTGGHLSTSGDSLFHGCENRTKYLYDFGGQRVVKHELTSDDTTGTGQDTLYVTEGLDLRNHHYERYVFDGSQRIARIGLAKPYDATAPPPAPEVMAASPVEAALAAIHPDQLSPREALDALYQLKAVMGKAPQA